MSSSAVLEKYDAYKINKPPKRKKSTFFDFLARSKDVLYS